jgi:preprotein translocase subunit SecA
MDLEERQRKVDTGVEVYYVKPDEPDKRVFAKRIDFADQVYGTSQAKDGAIVGEIARVQATGRPVLVGTTSVEHSEVIHRQLQKQGVPHSVLNAKIHQSEALVVAQAGRKGSVTISTNMAGRGTDILLGGNPEGLAAEAVEKELFDRPELAQLATRLFVEGEPAAREHAARHPRLTEDLVPALLELKAEFDAALEEIEQVQVIGYLARKLQEPYAVDYNDMRQVLRYVRAGQLGFARLHLENLGKDVALVDEAVRLWGLYNRYLAAHADPRQAAQFLAETLFERLYIARSALIRALMGNDRARAEELTRSIPGLPAAVIDVVEDIKSQTARERQEIWGLGGLHVVGSERHESRRIDNQLRGRAARQGDPGSSRFFLSLEDDLMRRFGGERLKGFMARTNIPEDMPIESGLLDRIIENSQERIEGYNFDIRKSVVEYDDVMSKQREAIYNERRSILMGDEVNLEERLEGAFETAIAELVDNYIDDYTTYVEGEVQRAIADYSTDATDAINVYGVLVRMRALLPAVATLDRSELAEASAARLSAALMTLASENRERGDNFYQFLQAAGRFLPLLPPVPNLGATLSNRKTGYIQVRENMRLDFLAQVEGFYNNFLAGQIDGEQRDEIWQRAAGRINTAFTDFSVEGQTIKAIEKQQTTFRQEVESGLRDLLLDSLSSLDADSLAEALSAYAVRLRDQWRAQIGEEEFDQFERLVVLDAIDREWRDYLIAMDDLRREIGMEALGQRDPKVEYKRRSFQMFADMKRNINRSIVDNYFRQIAGHQAYVERREAAAAYQTQLSQAGYQVVQREKGKGVELKRDAPKVGRNDPCPCGSGKKYKNCHMRTDQAGAGTQKPQRARAR